MPRALQERPKLTARIEQYLEAFLILDNFRNMNGDLSFSDIVKYASVIDEDDVLKFVKVLSIADNAFKKELRAKKEGLKEKDG